MTSQRSLGISSPVVSKAGYNGASVISVYRPFRCSRLCGKEGSDREKVCQTAKLTMLSMVSGLILVVVSAINLSQKVQDIRESTILGQNVRFSIEIGEVIHNIQIERGTTALYVSAGADPYLKPRLQEQYAQTDIALSKLSKWISVSTPNHFRSRATFAHALQSFRDKLDPVNATLRDIIGFYTDHNSVFIDMIAESTGLESNVPFRTDEVAYLLCVISKEQAGIERALGSTYFARDVFPIADLLWYVEKQSLGVHFLKQCTKYSPFVYNLLQELFTNTTLEANLEKMRTMIKRNAHMPGLVVEGEIWFDNMTAYIDLLKTVLNRLALRIIHKTNEQSSSIRNELIVNALELCIAIVIAPVVGIMVKNIAERIQAFTVQLRDKTQELEAERQRTNRLLHELLPSTVAQTLLSEGHVPPEQFNSATILFTDVVSFTNIASRSTPMQVISMLNKLYLTMDNQIDTFDVYKLETIGDAYMVASGIPRRNGERHVTEIAKLALRLLEKVSNLSIDHLEDEKLQLRLGFNTGPCVTGIVGSKMPRYCVYGDTVNIASRMESTALPLKIQMTETSANILLRQKETYTLRERGYLEVKGKGPMLTYWLEGHTEDDLEVKSIGCTSLGLVV